MNRDINRTHTEDSQTATALTREAAERMAGDCLTGKRLEHSLSAARLAAKIGEALALPARDLEALFIAGALHDIAKQFDDEKQYSLAARWYAIADDLPAPPSRAESAPSVPRGDCAPATRANMTTHSMTRNSALWHAPAAAWIIRQEFADADPRIARAAARHTTGASDMTRFEECLYAADFLDPCRPFAAQDAVWPLLERDFDEALLAMCRGTIESVLAKRRELDILSVEYYNELLLRLRRPGRQADAVCIRRERGEQA